MRSARPCPRWQPLLQSAAFQAFLVFLIMLFRGQTLLTTCQAYAGQNGASLQNTETGQNRTPADGGKPMMLHPIGRVVRQDDRVFLDILPQYAPALDGLSDFSHIWVIFWFHGNDTPEKRAILKVHPRKDPANPLTGVFATRAPVRPNPLGLTCCRLLNIQGSRLEVEGLDAWHDTPVLDLKPYIPGSDSLPQGRVPDWARRPPEI